MEAAGALVVVYRRTERGVEYLLMHRGESGPEHEGDWAWAPPCGEREPGETAEQCAARELEEETGLRLACVLDRAGTPAWPVYVAEAPPDCAIRVSEEHDRFEWLPLAAALPRVLPAVVREQLRRAAERLERGSSAE